MGTLIGAAGELATWPKEVSDPLPMPKNSMVLEPVSATAKTPKVGSISMAPGFNPALIDVADFWGGLLEKSGKSAMFVAAALLGTGIVLLAT